MRREGTDKHEKWHQNTPASRPRRCREHDREQRDEDKRHIGHRKREEHWLVTAGRVQFVSRCVEALQLGTVKLTLICRNTWLAQALTTHKRRDAVVHELAAFSRATLVESLTM